MDKHNQLTIEILDGRLAPRYPITTKELTVKEEVTTLEPTVVLEERNN